MEKILLVPDPLLRKEAKNLKTITFKDIDLSKKMIDIMLKAPGVGLAANQVGVLKKIITVHIHNEEKGTDNIYALFNPRIKLYSEKKIIMEEGCLSLPKQYAEIERPEAIIVKYINEKNEAVEEKKDGFEARVLHVQAQFDGVDESGASFTAGFDEQQGTFLEISKRTGNFGIFANNSVVSGESVSRQYTVVQYGISYWIQGTNAVLKANWYDKSYPNPSKNSSESDGIHLGMGYEF